jgi:hypothetical protein
VKPVETLPATAYYMARVRQRDAGGGARWVVDLGWHGSTKGVRGSHETRAAAVAHALEAVREAHAEGRALGLRLPPLVEVRVVELRDGREEVLERFSAPAEESL